MSPEQIGWRREQGSPWAGQATLRSASCHNAQCPGLLWAGQDGKGRRGSREDGSRGRAPEKWTIQEIPKSYPSFLRGAVSGKPTQGPFQLHRDLGALLY